VITADEVLLLNSLDSYVLQYAAELQRRLLQRAEGDELPFEFRALELALEAACSFLDAQVTIRTPKFVDPILTLIYVINRTCYLGDGAILCELSLLLFFQYAR
jgi:hypothetical protein